MKRSFLIRFFIGLLLIVGLLFGGISFFAYQSIKRAFIGNYCEDLKRTNTALIPILQPLLQRQDSAALRRQVKASSPVLGVRITVIDTTGRVLADSETDPRSMNLHRYRPEVQQALSGQVGAALRFSTTIERDLLYVATPIIERGAVIGIIRTSLAMQTIEPLLRSLFWQISGIGFVALLLMVAFLFLFTRQLQGRIRSLNEASRRVAGGDFTARVFFRTNDEFGQLAANFNAMTTELQQLFDRLRIEDSRLNTILSTMPSGLAAIAQDGRLLFFNAALARIFGDKVQSNRYYWEIILQPQLIELLQQTQTDQQEKSGEFDLEHKSYLVSSTYLPETQETLLIISDISPIKDMQRLKKEFVINVSHELRTPLTAIKGFVETLQDEFPHCERRYLEIIARHTDRLINIVNDLLLLSEIEETQQLTLEEIDLAKLVQDTLKIFEHSLAAKQLQVTLKIAPDAMQLKVDPFKFQQVLINLIDNAIKYTDQGSLIITARREGRQVILTISDTGIGIPAEHLPRIFERFYVVDKSRSRQLGGTGLGLAIAKHIILLHGGQIQVASTVGQGTRFTITLPQND